MRRRDRVREGGAVGRVGGRGLDLSEMILYSMTVSFCLLLTFFGFLSPGFYARSKKDGLPRQELLA